MVKLIQVPTLKTVQSVLPRASCYISTSVFGNDVRSMKTINTAYKDVVEKKNTKKSMKIKDF